MKLKNKLEIEWWRLGLHSRYKCPVCKGQLLGHGYDDDGDPPGRYTCQKEDCAFNLSEYDYSLEECD
jgi:hypothetical protein